MPHPTTGTPGETTRRTLRRHRRLRRAAGRAGAGALVVALAAVLGLPATAAQADTVYEIVGEWQTGTPGTLKDGDNVTSVWRFNINDDAPAPANDPVDNVTVTFTAQGGAFTNLPDECLLTPADPAVPLTPVSEIRDDGTVLVCNLGTREQGSAELLLTGLSVTGDTGQLTFVEAQIGDQEAALPPLDIVNPFAMDMKLDGGANATRGTGSTQIVAFPWSLRTGPGSDPGPATVTYTLTFTNTAGTGLNVLSPACQPIGDVRAEHPYSDATHDAAKTAPFPGSCSFTRIGTTNRFTLTIGGIDYSKAHVPTLDSAGNPLPADWEVVAAGELQLSFTYQQAGQVGFTTTAPTYTGTVSGASYADQTSNNANSIATTRGSWNGGWSLGSGTGLPGTQWTDTSRASAGDLVRAAASVRAPSDPGDWTVACNILDVKYLTFEAVHSGVFSSDSMTVTPYAGAGGIQYWYYVGTGPGNMLNPNSASYNPNGFTCDTGWGGVDWLSSPPADLSRVKAVRIDIPYSAAAGVNAADTAGIARSYVDSRIKPGVADGQDIWTWMSYNLTGRGTTGWFNQHRSSSPADVPASGVVTPGSRYAYTGGGRDVLRIVSARPLITKVADQTSTMPGATVQYTVTYRAVSPTVRTLPSYRIEDTLPAGTVYVAGSASTAPTSTGTHLVWNLTDVMTNTDYVLTYSIRIPDDAEVGDVFTNHAVATIGAQTAEAQDSVGIRDGGYIQLTKTAAAQKVPHSGGVAADSWTVRLTSHDTQGTAFTDTIDVLPFNGDGRGTDFAGTYTLSGPVQAMSGATVYYTTADPATLKDDPADSSNGAAGTVTGNTVGWSTAYAADATAVRVIGGLLGSGAQQQFTVAVVTDGAEHGDRYVNRAESRSARHQLVTRTSSAFEIGAVNSVTIKKYVQDGDGGWHDANDIDDYPAYHTGDTAPYRLVVTNTGDEPLQNVEISDDRVDLAALDPLPAGLTLLEGKAVIAEIQPGEDQQVVVEYQVPIAAGTAAGTLVNTACAIPEPVDPDAPNPPSVPAEEDCDPAGVIVLASSLSWQKTAADAPGTELLGGAEWELTPVDEDGLPTGAALAVTDCVAAAAEDCAGADTDETAGRFRVDPLDDGRYRLVETRAPAGYQLDATPRFIVVQGETAFEAPIVNELQEGPAMPLTGGLGTIWFTALTAVAGVLVAAGVLWQLRRTRHRITRD